MRQIRAEDQRAVSELRGAHGGRGGDGRLADAAFACIHDDAHTLRYTRKRGLD